jgi:hypothetical protein
MFGPIHINRLVAIAALVAAATSMSSAQTVYVDDDAPSPGDGLAWATAFRYLQDALDIAASGDLIKVAQGTYHPDEATTGHTPGYRAETFTLISGVVIEGGYIGYDDPNPDTRDTELYVTILSGDLGVAGDNTDNSYHVLSANGTDSATMLNGFVITGGYADKAHTYFATNAGAAVNCTSPTYPGQATFTNCIFRDNWAAAVGGAVASMGDSHLKFINCAFSGNRADGATSLGGAIYGSSVDNSLTMTNCTVVGNYAGQSGGGVFLSVDSSASITNCTFVGNQSGGAGSVGGLHVVGNAPNVDNCIFWDNALAQLAHPILSQVNHNAVQGGWTGGSGNISLDASTNPPQFLDPDGLDDAYGTPDDDLRLAAGSPCVDAGDNSVVTAATDLDGNTRVVGDAVDMGAYELQEVLVDPEQAAQDLAVDILALSLDLFNGPNANSNAGRANSLANRANEAADFIADGDIPSAIDVLTSLLKKIDGQSPPPDWMYDGSDEKTALAEQVSDLIELL